MAQRKGSSYKAVRIFSGKKYVLSEQFRTKGEAQRYATGKRKQNLVARVVKGSDPFWKYAVYVDWGKRKSARR